MSFIISDRVRETTDSIGTGTVSLNGAITGYQSFNNAVGTGNTCYYTIANPGYDEWEVGLGTVGVGILYRTTVLKSSNSNALVSFTTGHKDVFLTYPAQKTVLLDPSNNAPALGTPASINLANATGLQLTAITTAYTTLLKGNGSTVVNAVPGADYALPTVTGDHAILKANGTGGFADAIAGTDYVAPGGALGTPSSGNLTNCTGITLASLSTTSTSLLKGNGTGVTSATAGVDYIAPGGALGTPSSGTLTNCTGVPLTALTTASTSLLKGNGTGVTSATAGTDYA